MTTPKWELSFTLSSDILLKWFPVFSREIGESNYNFYSVHWLWVYLVLAVRA